MKQKVEKFLELNQEMKQCCYDLCNKWSEYRKSLDPLVSDWESDIYDYSKQRIEDLEFSYEDDEFMIGYEHTDRCGDTDNFYTYFKKEELLDENLIKEKIDKARQRKLMRIEQDKLEEKAKKAMLEKQEYQRYQILKQKFEPKN